MSTFFLLLLACFCHLVTSKRVFSNECKVPTEWVVNGTNPILEAAKGENVVVLGIVSDKHPKISKHTLYALNNFAKYRTVYTKTGIKVMAVSIHGTTKLPKRLRKQNPFLKIYAKPDDIDLEYILDIGKGDVLVFDKCGRMTFHYMYPYSSFEYPFVSDAMHYTVNYYTKVCGECDMLPSKTTEPLEDITGVATTQKPSVDEHFTDMIPYLENNFVPGNIPEEITKTNIDSEDASNHLSYIDMQNRMLKLNMERFGGAQKEKDDGSHSFFKPGEEEEETNEVEEMEDVKNVKNVKDRVSLMKKVLEIERKENKLMMDYILKGMRPSKPNKDSFNSKKIGYIGKESTSLSKESPSLVKIGSESTFAEKGLPFLTKKTQFITKISPSSEKKSPLIRNEESNEFERTKTETLTQEKIESVLKNKIVTPSSTLPSINEVPSEVNSEWEITTIGRSKPMTKARFIRDAKKKRERKDVKVIDKVLQMKRWENNLVLNYLLQKYIR